MTEEADEAGWSPRSDWWQKILNAIGFQSKEEATYLLLECAVVIDGETKAGESHILQTVSAHSPIFHAIAPSKLARIRESVRGRLDKARDSRNPDAIFEPIRAACTRIPQHWREPVFARVVDIVLSDATLTESETRFLPFLAKALGITPDAFKTLLQQFKIKNEHVQGRSRAPVRSKTKAPQSTSDLVLDSVRSLSPEEAHYVILKFPRWFLGASGPEGVELDPVWQAPSLAACDETLRLAIARRVDGFLETEGKDELLQLAFRYIDPAIRLSAFGQAVDIALLDQARRKDVRPLITKLETGLGILPTDAAPLVAAIEMKGRV